MLTGPGWQMDAKYVSTSSFNEAAVSFTVPPPPNDAGNHGNEVLYYFPYIENANHTELLQPVLTWDAFHSSWQVFVGYYHNGINGGTFIQSPSTYVHPGEVLTALMSPGSGMSGAAATIIGTMDTLYVPDLTLGANSGFDGPLNTFGVALEQYNVGDPNFAAPNITFDHIALISNGHAFNPASQMVPEIYYDNAGYQVNITGQGTAWGTIDLFHS